MRRRQESGSESMFENLTDRLQKVFRDLRGYGKLTPENIDEALRQVRLALLEADVNYRVVKEFISTISERAVGQDVLESLTPGQQIIKIVQRELVELLGGQTEQLKLDGRQPVVIMLAGLQGSGKTTTAAKLARLLKSKGRKPFLVPADVYRPAAIKQLQVLGETIGIDVYPSEPEMNPVEISRKALVAAEEKGLNTVIIDTAGRLHIDRELMAELRQINSVVEPAEILFVADAMTGQDAVTVAGQFKDDLDLTGVVLTKMEGDARGGAALSIKKVTGRPIKFVGIGEAMDALEVFHPDRLASRILGMGDVLSLIEKAEEVVDKKKAEKLARKIKKNEFSLEDFRDQIQQVKKLGSLEQIMGMMPGLNKMKQMQNMPKPDDSELVRTEAIINSMTPVERRNYQILNASRRQRIAGGSGTSVQDVNRVIKSYSQMLKMMKKMKGFSGGMEGGRKRRKLPKGLRR
jgi:signal recognition particle subunit SRP54